MSAPPFDRAWRVKTRLPERKGEPCRVLVWGRLRSCLVEFERDGLKVVTSWYSVRKRAQGG